MTSKKMLELPIPQDAPNAHESAEVLRAWIVDGALHCSLAPTAFEDGSTWGILLADVARHVAHAFQEEGANAQDVLDAIRTIFDEELANPTDEPTGHFVDEN